MDSRLTQQTERRMHSGHVHHPRNPALRRRMPRWCLGRVAGVDSLQRQLQRCVPDAKKAAGHRSFPLSALLAPLPTRNIAVHPNYCGNATVANSMCEDACSSLLDRNTAKAN